MIELIIADDHPVMIEGIRSALKDEHTIKITAEANNGEQLLKALASRSPDLVLMDVSMQDQTGIELALIIKEKYRDVKILFLSQFNDGWLIKKSLDVGAKAYLLKSISKKELIFSIHKVVEGEMDFFYKKGKL